jgi:hypothetical protein
MKKRILSAALALALALSLLPLHAFAADTSGGFADISDKETAQNVEVLRLLGVIGGDENGRFRPNDHLTRAEFCKMSIVLQGREEQVARYRSRTLFPDVRASHWAAGYINLASTAAGESQPGLMHGFPDGTFQPEKDISYGEAVTVLMRVLGYTDADTNGVWPQGYIDLGASAGLTAGLSVPGGDAITRAQAAKLFVGALRAEKAGGGTLMTLGEELTLLSIDMVKGVMRTTDGKTAPKETPMAVPMASTVFNGLKGRIIFNADEKAVSFLPSPAVTAGAGTAFTGLIEGESALIVTENGSSLGFDDLTGHAKNYTIWRNGVQIKTRDLKKYDVATYSVQNNAVYVCDTRVTVHYEGAMPNPREPLSITVLGGTVFSVIPSAQQGMTAYHPGQHMTLLLSADGRIAGVMEANSVNATSNALGYVDGSGKVTMFCGTQMLELNYTDADKAGRVVTIAQNKPNEVILGTRSSSVSGALVVSEGVVGTDKLAKNAMVLNDGVLTSVSELDKDRIEARQIVFTRRNSAGEIDLIVLGNRSTELIGRVNRWFEVDYVDENGNKQYKEYMSLTNPSGETDPSRFLYTADIGDFAVTLINSEKNFYDFVRLEKLKAVDAKSWIGTSVVNYGGKSYVVSEDIMCYNRDTGAWFKSLEDAMEYGGTINLYALDGVVRALDAGA